MVAPATRGRQQSCQVVAIATVATGWQPLVGAASGTPTSGHGHPDCASGSAAARRRRDAGPSPAGCTTRSGTCRSSPRTATSIRGSWWTTQPFADPASLFIQPDHYVTRLLHAGGVSLDRLGVGEGPLPEERAREVWRLLCANWHLLRGTPVRYWFDSELGEIFGVRERPSAENADALYDQIAEQLAAPDHRPRALLRRFGIDVLATTDDPADDLEAHARLAEDPEVSTRVVPTFRPDVYLEPARAGLGRRGQAPRRGGRQSTSATTTATWPRWRSAGGTSSSTARCRRTTATPTRSPRRWRQAEARAHLPLGAGRPGVRGRGDRVPPAHDPRDGEDVLRRRAGDDGAPRHPPQPPRRRPSPRTARTPATTSRSPWSSPTRCARCWTGTAPTRTSTWCSSPWTRTPSPARSRRWPASTRRSTPARPGGSSTAPR